MKKLKILLIVMLAFIMLFAFVAETRAVEGEETKQNKTMVLNITDERPYTKAKYTVTTPNSNVHKVFKILEADGEEFYSFKDAIYCLRSGLGFGNSAGINNVYDVEDVTYTEANNLKKDALNTIFALQETVSDDERIISENYNSILWIVDNMYLPEHENKEEMKEELLRKAGLENSKLTDDDIEFVQQMALWYFSNFDENGEENSLSLLFGENFSLSNSTKINDMNFSDESIENGEERASQIDDLYNYFIMNAKEYSKYYGTTNIREFQEIDPEISINSENKTKTEDNNFTVVGPFTITETSGNVWYNLKLEVKDKNGKNIPEKQGDLPIVFVVKNTTDMVQSFNSVKEAIGEGEFYLKISNRLASEYDLTDISIEAKIEKEEKAYRTTATLWLAKDADGNPLQPVVKVEKEKIKDFDLALRKYITKINEEPITTREPDIKKEDLNKNGVTTAEYKHSKQPIEVVNGDKVKYTISVYNEGEVDGIVTAIIDYLPEGLEFNIEDNPEFIQYQDHYEGDLANKKYAYTFSDETRALRISAVNSMIDDTLFSLSAFNGTTLDSESIEIVCRVTAQAEMEDIILTNIATMSYYPVATDGSITDRDSSAEKIDLPATEEMVNYKGNANNKAYLGDSEYFYKGQEDDDDFEKVVIKGVPFDLALRKFITKVNGEEVDTREPVVDTSKLNTVDTTTGEQITTAVYTHSKEPVVVKKGDIVTYKIRVYNEGDLDGYATEIVDYIPEGLGYLMGYKENTNNFWVPELSDTTKTINLVGEDGLYKNEAAIKNLKAEQFDTEKLNDVKILVGNAKISTDALEEEKIKAYNSEITVETIEENENWQASKEGTDGLYYEEVEVTCIVLAENTFEGKIRNIAEIYEDKAVITENEDERELENADDRDSTPKSVVTTSYSKQQQDDDDYELLELKYFDLALRKFITAVNEEEVTTRIPEAKIKEDGELEYIHSKEPVYVENSDLVTYTIRVYNEGTVKGYATEISDDIPDGLVFLPEHKTNKDYEWKMYDSEGKETEDITKAVEIRTSYLDEELLNAYDATKAISDTEPLNPDYVDVKVVFQVLEEGITAEDRIVINKAQITEDKAVEIKEDENGTEEKVLDLEDEDSIPGKWNEGEDDQDIEKIYVKKFDLALLKWVTKTIVTVDGKTTTTETGFTPYDDPEPIAKVIIDKKKLNKTSVKFAYNIMVENQGEIAGYAMEITDYIPEGLEFVAEDNPLWTKDGEGKITTRALEQKLLQPGEKATVEVIFTWKNDSENFGLKTNIAEISEDYNDKGAKDIDSTPDDVEIKDYDKQQQDDDDKALVILEPKTGGVSYIWLGLVVLVILAGGIVLIQKFVI